MAMRLAFGTIPWMAGTIQVPAVNGPMWPISGEVYGSQRLPSDPIGTFNLTLTNVVTGSRVHVEKQSDGTTFYDDVAVASTVVIPLSAYGAGSVFNDLRIKVRKASIGTAYQPWETLATAVVGSNEIFVSQIPDE